MRFSALHISDLHRDLSDEVDNPWLLESLARDFEQFRGQDPEIMRPTLCIVSGDLVYGVKPNAAAIGFFKQQRPVWTQWVSAEATADIDRAISGILTGLYRKCLDTGSGQGSFVWCK